MFSFLYGKTGIPICLRDFSPNYLWNAAVMWQNSTKFKPQIWIVSRHVSACYRILYRHVSHLTTWVQNNNSFTKCKIPKRGADGRSVWQEAIVFEMDSLHCVNQQHEIINTKYFVFQLMETNNYSLYVNYQLDALIIIYS
jgi:hypothetical protein